MSNFRNLITCIIAAAAAAASLSAPRQDLLIPTEAGLWSCARIQRKHMLTAASRGGATDAAPCAAHLRILAHGMDGTDLLVAKGQVAAPEEAGAS